MEGLEQCRQQNAKTKTQGSSTQLVFSFLETTRWDANSIGISNQPEIGGGKAELVGIRVNVGHRHDELELE